MKPVMIIIIAVVCSVVAVFAVLGGLMLYGEYQYEKAIDDFDEEIIRLESEHNKSCKKLFGHMLSEIGKPNLLQVCLDNQFYLYEFQEICGNMDISNFNECNNLWIQGQ